MAKKSWVEAAAADITHDPRTEEAHGVSPAVIASIISHHHRRCELWEAAVRLRLHVAALQFGQDGRCPTCGERRHDAMCPVGKVLRDTAFLDEVLDDDE